MTDLINDLPLPIDDETRRPVTKNLTAGEWVKENLFATKTSGVFTVLFALIFIQLFVFNITDALLQGEYKLGVVTNWLVNNEYEILRVNLRLWMVGRFPKEEVWRPVGAAWALCFTFSLTGGAMFESSRRQAIEAGTEPPESTPRDMLRRAWPMLALVGLVLILTQTIIPWVNAGVALGLLVAGRWIGQHLPEFVRSWAWWFPLVGLCSAIIMMQANSFLPLLATFVGLAVALVPKLLGPERPRLFRWAAMAGAMVASFLLASMLSGPLNDLVGDPGVGWDKWGGMMVNLLVAISGIVIAFPLGILLALGRRGSRTAPASNQTTIIGVICAVIGAIAFVVIFGTGTMVKPLGLVEFPFAAVGGAVIGGALGALSLSRQSTTPLFWGLSVTFIEFIRGVPLITLLFFGDSMLLFFFPKGFDAPSQVTRAMIVVTAFSAAYIAEIVRGGLQAVDKGQIEAAQAVGLPFGKVQRLIVLPQALRAVIPAMVGQFISLWKDTSLLGFISLTEILKVSRAANSQPDFQGRGLQDLTFMFVALIFWVVSYTMSRESQRLEKKLRGAER